MPHSELKLLRQLGSGIVGFTGFLVLLFGFWFWSGASSRPEGVASLTSRIASARSPASVPDEGRESVGGSAATILSQAVKAIQPDPKIDVISVGCFQNFSHLKYRSTARLIRVKFQPCRGFMADVDTSRIVNLANGYEGTLFKLGKGVITTDYIHLIDGENKLAVQMQDKSGALVGGDVTIFRPSGS